LVSFASSFAKEIEKETDSELCGIESLAGNDKGFVAPADGADRAFGMIGGRCEEIDLRDTGKKLDDVGLFAGGFGIAPLLDEKGDVYLDLGIDATFHPERSDRTDQFLEDGKPGFGLFVLAGSKRFRIRRGDEHGGFRFRPLGAVVRQLTVDFLGYE